MQRLSAIEPESATGKAKDLFTAVQGKLGSVPNMFRTMGNSPAVLEGYLSFNAAMAGGTLGAKLGELIALTIANANGCEYCNAAHSFIGEKMVRIDTGSLADAREGHSDDPRIAAALEFARTLVEKKGQVSDADVNKLRGAGYTDGGIAEVIAHVALNVFTNYFNTAARVVVDFPRVELVETAVI
ncbi:MAG TPA: carboxymuconolactone decarboxylase family protein [Puia sp.]|jgi:uncharacterized peroxidase-related enzyme